MGAISGYTAATAITDDDVLIGNDGSTTKKFPATVIKTYAQSGGSSVFVGVADDSTNNKAAFDAAVTALGAQGGTLFIPPGIYRFTTAPATIQSNVRIVGAGKNASVFRKTYNGVLLNFVGASNASRCQRGGVADIMLHGNDTTTGALINCKWADHMNFDRVWCYGNADSAVIFENVWDSYFNECEFEWCSGSDGFKPSVFFRSNADDSTNIIGFDHCRWESFRDGALWVSTAALSGGYVMTAGSNPAYGIYLHDCKMETSEIRGYVIAMSSDVGDFHVDGLYMAVRGLASGVTTGCLFVVANGASDCTFKRWRVRIDGVTNPTCESIFYIFADTYGLRIEDIFIDATQLPNTGAVQLAGGNPEGYIENVRYKAGQAGVIYSGTPSVTPGIGRRINRQFELRGAVTAITLPATVVALQASKKQWVSGVRSKLSGGTSATFKLQKNGSDITGFTGIVATPTMVSTNPTPVTLADGDVLTVVITAVSGSPLDLSVDVLITELG